MPVRRVAPLGAGYSESVAASGVGRWISVSGQLPVDDAGSLVGDRLAEQAEACFDRVEQALAAHGATLADVVRIGVYLTSLADFGQFADVRARRLAGNLPASTAVQVAGLLRSALVEVDAVAFVES